MKIGPFVLAALMTLALPATGVASLPVPSQAALFSGHFHGAASATSSEADDDPRTFAHRAAGGPYGAGAAEGFVFGVLTFGEERLQEKGKWSLTAERSRGNGLLGVTGRIEFRAATFDVRFHLSNDTIATPCVGGGGAFTAPEPNTARGVKPVAPNHAHPSGDDDPLFSYRLWAGLEVTLRYGLSPDLTYRYASPDSALYHSTSFTATEMGRERLNASVGIRIRF
jgi:opacity protein-like surface antigen